MVTVATSQKHAIQTINTQPLTSVSRKERLVQIVSKYFTELKKNIYAAQQKYCPSLKACLMAGGATTVTLLGAYALYATRRIPAPPTRFTLAQGITSAIVRPVPPALPTSRQYAPLSDELIPLLDLPRFKIYEGQWQKDAGDNGMKNSLAAKNLKSPALFTNFKPVTAVPTFNPRKTSYLFRGNPSFMRGVFSRAVLSGAPTPTKVRSKVRSLSEKPQSPGVCPLPQELQQSPVVCLPSEKSQLPGELTMSERTPTPLKGLSGQPPKSVKSKTTSVSTNNIQVGQSVQLGGAWGGYTGVVVSAGDSESLVCVLLKPTLVQDILLNNLDSPDKNWRPAVGKRINFRTGGQLEGKQGFVIEEQVQGNADQFKVRVVDGQNTLFITMSNNDITPVQGAVKTQTATVLLSSLSAGGVCEVTGGSWQNAYGVMLLNLRGEGEVPFQLLSTQNTVSLEEVPSYWKPTVGMSFALRLVNKQAKQDDDGIIVGQQGDKWQVMWLQRNQNPLLFARFNKDQQRVDLFENQGFFTEKLVGTIDLNVEGKPTGRPFEIRIT